jgi:hypothetical protein
MVRGIAIASRRHVSTHDRQPNLRSIFRPAPINAIIMVNSVVRSMTGNDVASLGTLMPSAPNAHAPIATQAIGSERGASLRTIGSHAVSSTKVPKPIRMKM